MQRAQRELRRETEHLVHLPKESSRLLHIAVDLGYDRMEALRLNTQVGEPRCNYFSLALNGFANMVGEMLDGHDGNVDTAADSLPPQRRASPHRTRPGRVRARLT